jgi:hypothetical protein
VKNTGDGFLASFRAWLMRFDVLWKSSAG